MTLHDYKYLAILLTLLTATTAGLIPFYRRLRTLEGHGFPRSEALASGVFLGAALIHMLGNSAAQFNALGYTYPLAFLICGGVFLILLFVEHIATEILHHQSKNMLSLVLLATIMLSFHSFFAGSALGLTQNFSTMLLILIAILAHKWAASFALAVQINQNNTPIKIGLFLFLIFVLMTPLGILTGNALMPKLNHFGFLAPTISAIAAGTFLYIGTLHGLQRSVMVKSCCNLRDFSFVIIGFTLMAIVAIWT
jgi:solute carrier family 39 (zinc transporter), member 1/2/3